jgi:UDP-glucuronate 4-epimerase
MNILVSGAAGFIGFHVAKKLLEKNFKVIGIDNLNNYYDKTLKLDRLKIIKKKIKFYKIDIINYKKLKYLFKKYKPDIVLHLAAQAGVRYSLKYPKKYINVNIKGFFNVLELSKIFNVEHFLFASSSSVYGKNKQTPFKETHDTSSQTNIYGVSKKTNEIMAHSFSHLFNMKCTALRFFTVYGPWGRPDMALFTFTKNILNNKKLKIFNNGNMIRDFTFIDDAVNYVFNIIKSKKNKNKKIFEIFNIANSSPIGILKFINIIELHLNKKAKIEKTQYFKTEMLKTHADSKKIKKNFFKVKETSLKLGIKKFILWYKNHYKYK